MIVVISVVALVTSTALADRLASYDIRWELTTDAEEGTPGCTIAWRVVEIWERSTPGYWYELLCGTSCTVYRDDIAIANIVSSTNGATYYTDYDVIPGSTHSYKVSAFNLITAKAYTKTCKFIYNVEIGANDILLEGNGGTVNVPVEVRKVYAGSSSIVSWDYNYSGDWLSVERIENGSRIAISAGKNETGMTREGTVTISKGNYYNWPIKVTQAGGAATAAYSSWAETNGLSGAWDEKDANGIYNVFRYVFNKPVDDFSETPLIGISFAEGKPVIKTPAVVNTSGLALSVLASDRVDGTGNVTNYTLNASGETSIDEEAKPSRFFRLKAVLAQ